jgi:uncharacterized membrane protein SirB2
MIPVWIWLGLIPSCFAIAVIDYFVMKDWNKCSACGHVSDRWYNWLLPTVLEVLLFLSGIAIGVMIGGGLK